VPQNHIHKLSDDPTFKTNRNLVRDLMTPAFLQKVSTTNRFCIATMSIRTITGGRTTSIHISTPFGRIVECQDGESAEAPI
jgi:hypothetical protein